MKIHTESAPLLTRIAQGMRDPYRLERALGVLLWIAFFAVLLSLGE